MDETYIKVHGQWVYLYRAVDKAGQIKKEQFKTGKLGGCDATMTKLWSVALVA
jgi:hypothetical protein